MSNYKIIERFKDVPEGDWNDWRWQLRNRITTVDGLIDVLKLSKDEKD
ncbi:lysine 2,3-aminomutase, partial [Candidatus Aerophobetes bacterium]